MQGKDDGIQEIQNEQIIHGTLLCVCVCVCVCALGNSFQ